MELKYSFIIPVYNRPGETKELLRSIWQQDFKSEFEVVIVEDGSTLSSREIVEEFSHCLTTKYLEKENTGPGNSRNYGMERAVGNYFLILDSDVLLPADYLTEVDKALKNNFIHCFGGPDAAHESFSSLQKAINYTMTSIFTTGGIRGNKRMKQNFQPRSFNMGLSKEAFEISGGFGRIHPGEDPDLALRLQKRGFETAFFHEAVVFHKRRLSWEKFSQQVYKFGLVRPILNKWHPQSGKLSFWFPTIFDLGFLLALLFFPFGIFFLIYCYLGYFLLIFLDASIKNKSLKIGYYAILATFIQFLGYGFGFCRSTCYIRILGVDPEMKFPTLFFQKC